MTHPSVLQELDFIIYTRGGGSWYFRPRSRGGLANFTPIAAMGHLISKSKFKTPTPPPPANFWQPYVWRPLYLSNLLCCRIFSWRLGECRPKIHPHQKISTSRYCGLHSLALMLIVASYSVLMATNVHKCVQASWPYSTIGDKSIWHSFKNSFIHHTILFNRH